MESGKLVKMEKDYTNEVDVALVQAESLTKAGKLQQAIDALAVLEKQTRSGADMPSNARILVAVVKLCFAAKDWKLLQEQIVMFSKKHGLLKQAVTKMVQEAVTFVALAPDSKTKLEFIDTLRTVTEGKIYIENERAKVTKVLAEIREAEGKIAEAADLLQDLQVETFGSMDRREKTEFILEQMRLNLLRKDLLRTMIISKKINVKYFDNEEVQDLKLRFYELMIQHGLSEGLFLDICKYYREVYQTKSVQEDETKRTEILRFIVIFIVLAPFDHEQKDLIHRISLDKHLEKLPPYQKLVQFFTTSELMRWPTISEVYRGDLQKTYVFSPATPEGVKRWEELHSRIIEHNIRVISQYYTRITIKRFTELLDLNMKEAEEFLSKLVSSKTVFAKTDRLDGIISFTARKAAEEIIDEWSTKVHSLLELVGKTTHLISKEEMIHKIANKSTAVNAD